MYRFANTLYSPQELDAKTISRLEKAVAKSEYSQGKKLKIVTTVSRTSLHIAFPGNPSLT